MSHVFHQLFYHFAWATHSREPLIDRAWRAELLRIINEEVKTRGGFPLRHNAMPDHAHVLCRLPPTLLIADFVGQLKGGDLADASVRGEAAHGARAVGKVNGSVRNTDGRLQDIGAVGVRRQGRRRELGARSHAPFSIDQPQ